MRIFRSQEGQSLVQVLIGASIMGITALIFSTMMTNQTRETKALNEKLASLDLEKVLISSLADGNVCTYVLNHPSALTFDSAHLPQTISLGSSGKLYANILPGPPPVPGHVVAQVGTQASPVANSVFVQSIDLEITSGAAGSYSANWKVGFDSSKLIRGIKPLNVSTQLTANDATDPAHAIITACQGGSATSGQVCGMRMVWCQNALVTYDYNSTNVPCKGNSLTTTCNGGAGVGAVSNCPTGYTGQKVLTVAGGTAPVSNSFIFCVSN